ncbi:sugar phosphate nucleotidyltransferase [Pseudoalteromonas peptidolytica]|uniref:sugar phosphate nucleotidyltransferase n=1 Tax=Pseudoalteromonas peptidolytica TaxID=61150 RepID=UPI00142EE656|nr:sugar phosphate nucleotidyltransferase [Pseudoalteromonas peptidolytica]
MNTLPTLVVLAGGKGTRLKSVVNDRPKVLAKINGVPFIQHLLTWCQKQGITRIHFCLGYRAEQVIRWLREENKSQIAVSWQVEKEARGTGGAICDAISYLESKHECTEILVCNGDTFVEFEVEQFVSTSQVCGGGILTTTVDNASRFGAIKKSQGLLTSFVEKEEKQEEGEINAGWYYLGKSHLDTLRVRAIFSFEREYLMDLSRPPIQCINKGSNFLDFGTPESYLHAQFIFQELL